MQVYVGSKKVNVADGNFVEIQTGSPENPKVWIGTQAEYDAIEVKNENCIYIRKDAETTVNVWRVEDGVPSDGLGNDGDSYVNSTNGDYYVKINGSYHFKLNIKGVQGEKGDKGDTGATGAMGAVGPKGDKGDKGDTGADGADGVGILEVFSDHVLSGSGGINAIDNFNDDVTFHFRKLGKLVYFTGQFLVNFQGSGTSPNRGTVTFSGLPYTPKYLQVVHVHAFGSSASLHYNSAIVNTFGNLSVKLVHEQLNNAGLNDSARTITVSGTYLID